MKSFEGFMFRVMIVSLLTVMLVAAVIGLGNLTQSEFGFNVSVFGFEDGSHVANVGRYQISWCDHNALCDSSGRDSLLRVSEWDADHALLEVKAFDDPYGE